MNIKPTQIPEVDGDQSKYSLVIAVAKRAREISEEAAKREEILVEKPVDLAVGDMIQHRYRIIPAPKTDEDDKFEPQTEAYFDPDMKE